MYFEVVKVLLNCSAILLLFFFFKIYLFILGGGAEGERGADSVLGWEPTWGSTAQRWDYHLSRNEESDAWLTVPRRRLLLLFSFNVNSLVYSNDE